MSNQAQPLAGRERELELLERCFEEACAGTPRFAFISGEPGIGKTRLLVELLDRADARGVLALRGSASEFERALPFGLLIGAIDEYLESFDPHAFSGLSPVDRHELAAVFPSLRASDPSAGRPATPTERVRTHGAVRALIERFAVKQPVLLLLDDLHWADGASIEFASHLLRHPPRAAVMVVATFRAGQADRTLIAAIERAATDAEAVERIALGPLTRADAAGLIGAVGVAERERFYEASGGNPFYLLELARMSDDPAPGAGVPAAIAAAIVAELDVLPPGPRRLAEAAAVAGDPFELDLALTTAEMPEAAALAALDELIGHDLVRPEEVPRRFRFRHPLVRRAVYQSCPPGARIAAHRRTADALAARGAPAATRAHHVEHAARHGDLAAVALLRDAGEATASRAPASAARWFAVALGLLPEGEPADARVTLLTSLAGARAATGRFEDSRAALVEAIALTPAGDPRRGALTGACAGFEQLLGHHEAARDRLIAALDGLRDDTSPEAAALMIQLAVGDFFRMDYVAMRAWGLRALRAAHRMSAPTLIAASTAVLAVAAAFTGAIPDATAYSVETAGLVDALGDDELALRLDTLVNLATAELYLHRFEAAGAHARRGLAIARATGQGDLPPVLVPVLSNVLHTTGHMTESAALLDGAVEAARLSGNAQALGWNLLSRAFTALDAGDLRTALAAAQESVDITRDLDDTLVSTYACVALASALCESGEPGRAIEVLVTAAGGEDLPLIAGGWRASYLELLARCWIAVDRPADAERAAERAAAVAAELALPLATSMASRAAALVALERGAPAAAANHALAAAAEADTVGAVVEAARARTLAGRAFGRLDERTRAVAELECAVADLDRCGAVRYRQEAERDLRKLGRHTQRPVRHGDPNATGVAALTHREAEVAHLVVDRRTNPEIAGELFLSVKTIETHLRSIFRKLDVSSRHEVARVVERAELGR
ncbi:MAG: AAA family ATPase [Solirubrobacteraceae bacterium]